MRHRPTHYESPAPRTVADRVVGVVLAGAVGDALGAGYEFAPPPEPSDVRMLPGTLTGQPAGYWTDDTAMAVAVLEAAATYGTLITTPAVAAVGDRFLEWYRSDPPDVGLQTRSVLARAASGSQLAALATEQLASDPTRAGNGSLMRTGPVALAHLDDETSLALAARSISALTHAAPYALDACVLWTTAISRTVRTGRLVSPRAGLPLLDESRRSSWERWIHAAETQDPRTFRPNGYVVTALQAAWSAIWSTRHAGDPLVAGLRQAVAIGDDTDTVATIAGYLLGAAHGASSIPREWVRGLAGWPAGYDADDLSILALRAARLTDAPTVGREKGAP